MAVGRELEGSGSKAGLGDHRGRFDVYTSTQWRREYLDEGICDTLLDVMDAGTTELCLRRDACEDGDRERRPLRGSTRTEPEHEWKMVEM